MGEGVHGVFAFPISVAAQLARPVGALDLFRAEPGPLHGDALAGAVIAAELAASSLLRLFTSGALERDQDGDQDGDQDLGRDVHANSTAAGDPADTGRSGRPDGVGGRGGDALDLNRVEVYQATGMLIQQLDVGPGEAVVRLRAHAMVTGRTVSEVAFDIIDRRLTLRRDDPSPHRQPNGPPGGSPGEYPGGSLGRSADSLGQRSGDGTEDRPEDGAEDGHMGGAGEERGTE